MDGPCRSAVGTLQWNQMLPDLVEARCEHWWSLDRNGAGSPHQLFGAESNLFSTANILLRENRGLSVTTTGQYYSNNVHKQDGGNHSNSLSDLTVEIWNWCINHLIIIHAEHLPGVQNIQADWESRHARDSSDWKLDRKIFLCLVERLGTFSINLFASRTNNQLPVYCSWKPDPAAMAIDALSIPWMGHFPYMFPQFALIYQVTQGENFGSTNCPSVVQPNMVCIASEQPDELADSLTPNTTDCDQLSRLELSSGSGGTLPTSCLACIRKSSQAKGLSDRAIDIIRKS